MEVTVSHLGRFASGGPEQLTPSQHFTASHAPAAPSDPVQQPQLIASSLQPSKSTTTSNSSPTRALPAQVIQSATGEVSVGHSQQLFADADETSMETPNARRTDLENFILFVSVQ